MKKISSLFLLTTIFLMGCTTIPENHLAVTKRWGSKVDFFEGPKYTYIRGTSQVVWNGRRIIDLPLNSGKDAQYKTRNTYINLDLNIVYQLGKTKAERTKWYVKKTNPEKQFKKDVDGVVRSTVSGYTYKEVLNASLAKKNGKLPIYAQVALDLANSNINKAYGVDPKSYAVWPGNISLLNKSVMADLQRQRQVILRTARADAQKYKEKAALERAKVDARYSKFITSLTQSQRAYLNAFDRVNAIKSVSKDKGQEVDITLVVQ